MHTCTLASLELPYEQKGSRCGAGTGNSQRGNPNARAHGQWSLGELWLPTVSKRGTPIATGRLALLLESHREVACGGHRGLAHHERLRVRVVVEGQLTRGLVSNLNFRS